MKERHTPTVIIVTPALADANNGNWRTAHRWQQILAPKFRTIVQADWQIESCDALIALHARRSAAAIKRFREAHPSKALILTLTGTDLYRDLETSEDARQCLRLADRLIVLQEDAIRFVPPEYRRKTHVIYQSAAALTPAIKPRDRLNAVAVGHLRAEKDPETIFRAMARLSSETDIHMLHIGAPLDKGLAKQAMALAATNENYHWANALAHGLTRAALKRAHVLVHSSVMEGGANVIVEAITAGTPVIASEMSGNIGMLGSAYEGYFPVGDDAALAELLRKCLHDANFLLRLNNASRARAKLFSPKAESAALYAVVEQVLRVKT
jgi:putative glycosyltransferase (TIGR04348 family)